MLPDRPESTDAETSAPETSGTEADGATSGQILQFRKRWGAAARRRGSAMVAGDGAAEPTDDLAQYEVEDRHIDYRRRMLMNVIAVVIVAMLVGAGVWIADTIAAMEKIQDCAMQGRQNCAPIAVPVKPDRP